MIKQLDIYWVDLEPTVGAETQKKRPCVVLQSDAALNRSKTVIIAPILPKHRTWPFAVNVIPTSQNCIDKDRHINLKQIRAVDLSRITTLQGRLESFYLNRIQLAIEAVFFS